MDAVVIQKNNVPYAQCGGKVENINCENTDPLGDYWGVPAKESGIFRGYKIQKAVSAPTPDSIPLVRIFDKYNGNTLHLLGTQAQFLDACGGGAPMPAKSTIPIVVPEISLQTCKAVSGNITEFWTPPAKAGGQTYTVAAMYNNTQPTAPLTGAATVAAIVTYLNTNYAAAGTFSDQSGRIRLVRASSAGDAKFGLTFNVV